MGKTAWFIGSAAVACIGLSSLPAAAGTGVQVQIKTVAHARHAAPVPVWVPGHWTWDGHRHAWRAGHWRAPQPVYVQPKYGYVQPGYGHVQPGPAHFPRRLHRPYRDRDRDGIPNRYDRDRDGDGVPNRFDRRPNNGWRY